MSDGEIIPVILCGGSGTRLWPRSRATSPKPFLPLIGDRTLFQQTLARVSGKPFAEPIIVTGAAHAGLVEEQLDGLPVREIIVENESKNTAAAAALAAARVEPDSVLLILPSDHFVADPDDFRRAAVEAATLARQHWLVCLAAPATSAETRFGYIHLGDALEDPGYRVDRFVEKPSAESAREFIQSGQFSWNAGIFAFRAGDYLGELRAFRPDMEASVRAAVAGGNLTGGRFHPEPRSFSAVEPESIDYAVMENTRRAAAVILRSGWSDVGNWIALHRARAKDGAGNSVHGPAELKDCRNLLVDSDGPTVHAFGIADLIVVVDGDDILIASTSSTEDIRTPADKPA
jgi:mannose-1-phosphate guanylyltransferase/mannose-6-phosphate isomerase